MNLSLKHDVTPLIKIALPLAVNGVVQSGIYFFETLFFAHVNQETLAAYALVGWLYGTIAVILFGAMSSINVLIAHKFGEQDDAGIKHIVRDGLLMALILLIPSFYFSGICRLFFYYFTNDLKLWHLQILIYMRSRGDCCQTLLSWLFWK